MQNALLKQRKGTALVFQNKEYSYQDLINQANSYKDLIEPYKPDKILLFSDNRPEWTFAFYSGWLADAIVIPVDPMSTSGEIRYIVDDSKPEIIYCSEKKLPLVQEALNEAAYIPKVLVIEELTLSAPKEVKTIENPNPDKTALIIYTSGTTGNPKGVMLSYQNLFTNLKAVCDDIPIYNASERVMILLPLHHIFPLLGTLIAPVYVGATMVIAPGLSSKDIMQTFQKHKITMMIGVPRLYSIIRKGIMDKIEKNKTIHGLFRLAEKINSSRFSRLLFSSVHKKFGGSLKYLICGGAPLDIEVARDFRTLGFQILEGFGMTESAPKLSFTRPGKWKLGWAGQLLPGIDVKAKDGEIIARGGNIMQGYLNRPEETNEVIKDGWLHTGDLGEIDKKNYIRITGRKKEIIVLSNGKNINPAYLEAELEVNVPEIKETAVLMQDEALHALVIPEDEVDFGGEMPEKFFKKRINESYNSKVAQYKRINRFTLLHCELPRTRLGKLRRFQLRECFEEAGAFAAKSNENLMEFEAIKTFLKSHKSVDVSPTDNLEFDLGLDSIDTLTLQTFLESSFGVDLHPENIKKFPSVMKLAEYIKEKKKQFKETTVNWSDILKEKTHQQLKLPNASWVGIASVKITKYFFKLYFRMRYKGLNNLPDGPAILAPNHQSFLDGLMLASVMKRRTYKNTVFYAKKKHFNTKFLRYVAQKNNIVLVDMQTALRESIQILAKALKNNKNIIIFPEGTRSEDGKVGEFKNLFSVLSRELQVPVIPVAIKGTHKALPKGSHFPRPFTKVEIKFLEPVYPSQEDPDVMAKEVRSRILSVAG